MKNKEIEELLKGMRDVSNTEGACINLDRYLVKLLLLYIEQLEKECESNGRIIHMLQNNRDKAIEYVEHHKFNKFGDIDCNEAEDIIDILKGDSDD